MKQFKPSKSGSGIFTVDLKQQARAFDQIRERDYVVTAITTYSVKTRSGRFVYRVRLWYERNL